MRLKLEEIPTSGLELDEPLPLAFCEDALPARCGLVAEGIGRAQLRIAREGERVDVSGRAEMPTAGECATCLAPIRPKVEARLSIVLFRAIPGGEKPVEQEVSAADVGSGEHDGKNVEWGELVREELALAVPMVARCKADCLGLCPTCGVNRNTTACDCAEKKIDPRWEKLRLVKLE
jgi:uncharacterized protein